MTIADFLLARIAEDEANVPMDHVSEWRRAGSDDPWQTGDLTATGEYTVRTREVGPSRRVLAECEAKRRIIELHRPRGTGADAAHCCTDPDDPGLGERMHFGGEPCLTLRILATIYADHPDYQDDWRP